MRFGATGKFPEGKLDETDEGALTLGVAADHRNQVVFVDFGKPVAWIGLSKELAIQFADLLRKRAEEL